MADPGFGFDLGLTGLVNMVEDRFGRMAGNVFLVIVVIGIASVFVWASFTLIVLPTASYIGPINAEGGLTLLSITLENIDIWITALFYLLVVLFVVLIIVLLRTRRRVSPKILNELARLLDEGNNKLLNRLVTTQAEYRNWKADMDRWVDTVLEILKSKVSESEHLLFKNLVSVVPKQFIHALDASHNQELVFLDWRLGRLRSIIDRYSV